MLDKNTNNSTTNISKELPFIDKHPHIVVMVNNIKIEKPSSDFGYEFEKKYRKFNINNGQFIGYVNAGIANAILEGKEYCFWFSYLGTDSKILVKMFLETRFI